MPNSPPRSAARSIVSRAVKALVKLVARCCLRLWCAGQERHTCCSDGYGTKKKDLFICFASSRGARVCIVAVRMQSFSTPSSFESALPFASFAPVSVQKFAIQMATIYMCCIAAWAVSNPSGRRRRAAALAFVFCRATLMLMNTLAST